MNKWIDPKIINSRLLCCQSTLYVLRLFYSDNEIITVCSRPAICTLIRWFLSVHFLVCFCELNQEYSSWISFLMVVYRKEAQNVDKNGVKIDPNLPHQPSPEFPLLLDCSPWILKLYSTPLSQLFHPHLCQISQKCLWKKFKFIQLGSQRTQRNASQGWKPGINHL